MDFVVGDIVRLGFGFANPNHAAAAICALFPFCWGWRGNCNVESVERSDVRARNVSHGGGKAFCKYS